MEHVSAPEPAHPIASCEGCLANTAGILVAVVDNKVHVLVCLWWLLHWCRSEHWDILSLEVRGLSRGGVRGRVSSRAAESDRVQKCFFPLCLSVGSVLFPDLRGELQGSADLEEPVQRWRGSVGVGQPRWGLGRSNSH